MINLRLAILFACTENIGYHHSFTVTQYWDETLYIYQHTVYEVHEAAEVNYLSSDMKRALQHPINVPIYQEDLSGSVDVDINKASHQPSNYRDHSNHDPPSHSTDPSNSMDTCSKKSFDNIELKQETLTVHSRLLKILSFNIWNTNVVQGGYKQYLSRIKQIAKVSQFIYSSRECTNVILYFKQDTEFLITVICLNP